MKTIKIGRLEIREGVKYSKKEINKRFSKVLNENQLKQLNFVMNGDNGTKSTKRTPKKVRKSKGDRK